MSEPDKSCSAGSAELANWHLIARGVKERLENCDGFWRSCSGCYETEDGQNVHGYPHSNVFGCTLGGGCSECGGIGAVWDTTDYADMGETLAAEMHSGIPAQAVGMRAALERAQKIIERDYPSGQLAIDIRAVLAAQSPTAPVETPRIPKVRTSHHRNKEEAARLQALVDERYAQSSAGRETELLAT